MVWGNSSPVLLFSKPGFMFWCAASSLFKIKMPSVFFINVNRILNDSHATEEVTRFLSMSQEWIHRWAAKAMKQQLKFIESKSILLKVKIQSQMGEWASSRGSCTALLWVWGFYVLISLRDGIFIMLGDLCRKKMVSLTIRETLFFLPYLVLTERTVMVSDA